MSQIFTDDEIIAETPKQKRVLQTIRWIVKLLVTVLTAVTTTVGMQSCVLA